MKIRNVFDEIYKGVNINTSQSEEFSQEIYTFNRDALQYANLLETKLEKVVVNKQIKPKYVVQGRDIIISIKKPYKAATLQRKIDKKIVVPNNFVILKFNEEIRNKYSYIFLTNYLDRIGLKKYADENKIDNELSVEDIKNIELPDIPKTKQMSISNLLNNINERSSLYSRLLENDSEIVRYVINKIVGDNND